MNPKRVLTLSFIIISLISLGYVTAIANSYIDQNESQLGSHQWFSIQITATPRPRILEVSFIDVGQGDSALISDDYGNDILIDGGQSSAGPTVVAYIRDQNIDDIDVMVASHADSDHIGGLINVLEAVDIPVEQVLYNGYPGDTPTWYDFVNAVTDKGLTLVPAQFPLELIWGVTKAYILNPLPGLSNPDQNDVSVVILLDYRDTEFLFTGDIETSIENEIIGRGTPIAAEVLKVSDHGSEYATGDYFLSQVLPKEAVISVGENSYGHPSPETIARLIASGARIWRTDERETIVVNSNGRTYSVYAAFADVPYLILLPVVLNEKPELSLTINLNPKPTFTEHPTITPYLDPTQTSTATPTQ